MRLGPDSPQRADEQRSYFPDWTPYLPKGREELEADHNSYLAGGYAEEFGYLSGPGVSRGVSVLDGGPPEESAEWRMEAAAMHPGYPITPYPLAPDHEPAMTCERSLEIEASVTSQGGFITVADRAYEREHRRSGRRVAAVVTRLLGRLVALRWELPRRRAKF
jgi:hypothetical protein